jgi:hypothetical protein
MEPESMDDLQNQMELLLGNLKILLDNQQHKGALDEVIVQNQSIIVKNLEVIVKNQINIIENQKYIVENQITLGVILDTQVRTLALTHQVLQKEKTIAEVWEEVEQVRAKKTESFSTRKINNPTLI